MSDIVRKLRVLADPTRLRILALLTREELSVHELQEITRMGQSRISTHLGQMQESGFLTSRREGKRTFYRPHPRPGDETRRLLELALAGAGELPEADSDQVNLKRVLGLRERLSDMRFHQVAGQFDRTYGPGRSWQAFGHLLLRMLPPVTVADLGAGEGLLSELLARRCRKVIAVDISERMVSLGRDRARHFEVSNLEFRVGDLEDPPIDPGSVDVAIMSLALHHANDPARAIRRAHDILRPKGEILILDLRQHDYEKARELYGDRWLGFSESDLHEWLEAAGFQDIEISVVAQETRPPHFETLLAGGTRRRAEGRSTTKTP